MLKEISSDPNLTVHCIIRNEDRFVWFALMSVLPYVSKILIYDTGSTDMTVQAVKSIKSKKIIFEERGETSPSNLTKLRGEQIDRTDSDFFMLLDGDEIWPADGMREIVLATKNWPAEKIAGFCRTKNAVGDVWHYLPDDAGKYHFAGYKGHLNMRLFRSSRQLSVAGTYPLEGYTYQGRPLNDWDEKLFYIDTWYLHATHLQRSSLSDQVLGFRRRTKEQGIALEKKELPEVFFDQYPGFISDPLTKRSFGFEVQSLISTPLKKLKRRFIE